MWFFETLCPLMKTLIPNIKNWHVWIPAVYQKSAILVALSDRWLTYWSFYLITCATQSSASWLWPSHTKHNLGRSHLDTIVINRFWSATQYMRLTVAGQTCWGCVLKLARKSWRMGRKKENKRTLLVLFIRGARCFKFLEPFLTDEV